MKTTSKQKRITSLNDIKGHPMLIQYCKEHLEGGTLPQFLIFEGEEGLGKTSLAEILAVELCYGNNPEEREKALNEIIGKNRSNERIKKYDMSIEGGKEVAKTVASEFNMSLTKGNKVLILDECHGMSESAQDVLLPMTDTGRIPQGLYVIMLTTEAIKLKKTLRSRAVPIHFHRLKQSEMISVLREEMELRNMNIQGGDATLSLIATWSECKPRAGITLLRGFAENSNIPASMIKELIGYLEVEDVIPVVSCLYSSLTAGISYISEMRLDDSFTEILIEILKVVLGHGSYKLSPEETKRVRSDFSSYDAEPLINFVGEISGLTRLTKSKVISAFIECHTLRKRVESYEPNVLKEELNQKISEEAPPVEINKSVAAPNIQSLLMNSSSVSIKK